jgi:DNA-binding transcriptional regulator YhcF (GntR family)
MLLNISPHSELTLQDQIVGQIRARILRGELEPDEPLTSIRAMSQTLKVGVNTVQRAYDLLLKEDLIYARPGKGFFVAPLNPGTKSTLARQRFSGALEALMLDATHEGLAGNEIRQLFDRLLTRLHPGATDGDA